MALNPNKLAFSRQSLYIPVTTFSGLLPALTVFGGDASITAIGLADDQAGFNLAKASATTYSSYAPVSMASAHDPLGASSNLAEISTSGLVGLKMGTAGFKVGHVMPIPDHWDRKHPIYVRVAWTSGSSTAADTVDWLFTYSRMIRGLTVLTSLEDIALDTAIAQDTADATAYTIQETPNGILNGGALENSSNNAIHSWLQFNVELEDFAVGLTEDKFLLGVTFEYTPRFGRNIQSASKANTFGQDGYVLTHSD